MTRHWVRLEPGRRENAMAGGIALLAGAAVAGVLFYFGRILISREELGPRRAVAAPDDGGETPPERQLPSGRERRR